MAKYATSKPEKCTVSKKLSIGKRFMYLGIRMEARERKVQRDKKHAAENM
jgi:hypothetical protein